ncbi:MAG: recombination protein O N-terminal domain-containing protein [Patescibacteria group bacterium]
MAHHIYQTEAFVVGTLPRSEADKSILFFTRELGMIRAVAKGVRLGKSKLSGHLQDYTYGTFAFVKGRDVWRITDASALPVLIRNTKADKVRYETYVKILMLLKRMLRGEESHPVLFDLVKSGLTYLNDVPTLTQDEALALECLVIIRVLHALGYVGESASTKGFTDTHEFSHMLLQELLKNRSSIIKTINLGLRESHL